MALVSNIDDFCYARAGSVTGALFAEQNKDLGQIVIKTEQHHKALLLLHGFSSTPLVFRQLLPALTGYDALVCPCLPGHGATIQAFSHSTAHAWLSCAEQALCALQHRYAVVDVMGLSLGGLLAWYLAQQHRIDHVYLLAPALCLQQNIRWTTYLLKCLRCLGFVTVRNLAGNLCSSTASELTYRRLSLTAILEIFQLIRAVSWRMPLCPIDVFLGQFDDVVDSAQLAAFFAQQASAQIHWLPRSAHILPLEADSDVIARIVNATRKNGCSRSTKS